MPGLPCDRLLVAAGESSFCAQLPQYATRLTSMFAREVRVVMSDAAAAVCAPGSIEGVTGSVTLTEAAGAATGEEWIVRAARWAELVLVLPAPVTCLATVAGGAADDLLSTVVLSAECPAVFAPAMPEPVWRGADVQRNVKALRAAGHYVVPPQRGVSVATRQLDEVGPDPDALMTHLWHFTATRADLRWRASP